MDWREYELEIERHFRQCYPSATITRDARLTGRFSKVERQIDVLIEEQGSDFSFRIVVDAKFRGRKLDVADVEAFLGFVKDVDAHTGMIIALEGYSEAAHNRAYFDDQDIFLDILNFEEFRAFQGQTGIPYSGAHGVCIEAPLGWLVDGTPRNGMLATLYLRGLSFEEALQREEWMYINFCQKTEGRPDLAAVTSEQDQYIRQGIKDCKLEYIEAVRFQVCGARTQIRRLVLQTTPIRELTGFVDFPEFVFLCVLFTHEKLEAVNLRKLRFVMRGAFEMKIVQPPRVSPELPSP